jgi:hypothetical protein
MSFDDEISIEGMVGGANRGPIDDEVAAKPTYQIGAANQGLVDDAMTPDDEALENESDEDSDSDVRYVSHIVYKDFRLDTWDRNDFLDEKSFSFRQGCRGEKNFFCKLKTHVTILQIDEILPEKE